MVVEHLCRSAMKAAAMQAVRGCSGRGCGTIVLPLPLALALPMATQILRGDQTGTQFTPGQRSQRLRAVACIKGARIGKSHVHEAVIPERG